MNRKSLLLISILILNLSGCKLLRNKRNIVTDIDGNEYHSVKIGTQTWLVENLKVTHYNNGEPIPNVSDSIQWKNLKIGAYCDFKNTESYSLTNGRLYNWHATNIHKNICPKGWHVPTDREWTILTEFLGGEKIAGGKLKESGTTHWTPPNDGANNQTGFTGLPGGCRVSGTYFYREEKYNGNYARFWTSTELDDYAYVRFLNFYDTKVFRTYHPKGEGYYIRCIKDN